VAQYEGGGGRWLFTLDISYVRGLRLLFLWWYERCSPLLELGLNVVDLPPSKRVNCKEERGLIFSITKGEHDCE